MPLKVKHTKIFRVKFSASFTARLQVHHALEDVDIAEADVEGAGDLHGVRAGGEQLPR